MAKDRDNFDLDLKAALKDAYGDHRAPDDLRRRVDGAIAAALARPPAQPKPKKLPRQRWRLPRSLKWPQWVAISAVAAAAVALILVIATTLLTSHTLEASLEAAAKAHDQPDAATMQRLPDNLIADPRALADHLRKSQGRFIPVPTLAPMGWRLDEAAEGTIGGYPAVQLTYVRGARRLSVISLPKEAAPRARDGDDFFTRINLVPLTGIFRAGGIHLIVADPDLSDQELMLLTAALRKHCYPEPLPGSTR